jgi:hypothetical protein
MAFYGVPLHIIRQLVNAIYSFQQKLAELLRYRRATASMNNRFANASTEEMHDKLCPICLEEMQSAKKLPCGHVVHLHCLRSWLERSQLCPVCQSSVLDEAARQQRPQQQPPPPQQQQQQQQPPPQRLQQLPQHQIQPLQAILQQQLQLQQLQQLYAHPPPAASTASPASTQQSQTPSKLELDMMKEVVQLRNTVSQLVDRVEFLTGLVQQSTPTTSPSSVRAQRDNESATTTSTSISAETTTTAATTSAPSSPSTSHLSSSSSLKAEVTVDDREKEELRQRRLLRLSQQQLQQQ